MNYLKDSFYEILTGKHFFNYFYKLKGESYFFLFKKNLRVTNIQYGELLNLVNLHIKHKDERDISRKVRFYSINDFNNTLKEIVNDYQITYHKNDMHSVAGMLAETYKELLENAVVVDYFYGSCAIFCPPNHFLDLASICASSGYIHSCGENLYIRNIKKADENLFTSILENKASEKTKGDERMFLCVYNHEDFSSFDRDSSDELKNGLDDVKLYEEKFYIGKLSIVDFLERIRKNENNKIFVPPRISYEFHPEIKQDASNKIDRHKTAFLIKDRSVNLGDQRYPGKDTYYICYLQEYVNENPYHIFDEDKLAWKSSTTIPHSLMGAMLNLGVANANNSVLKLSVADPFFGSGTTFFECLKFSNVDYYFSDLDEFTCLLLNDNIEFYNLGNDKLDGLSSWIWKEYIEPLSDMFENPKFNMLQAHGLKIRRNIIPAIQSAFKEFSLNELKDEELFITKDLAEKIKSFDLQQKFVFYMVVRTRLRYINYFKKHKIAEGDYEKVLKPFSKEVIKFHEKLKKYIKLKKQGGYIDKNTSVLYKISEGNYSWSIQTSEIPKSIKTEDFLVCGQEGDILNLPEDSFDIIVTDPPYGFNVRKNINDLAIFYKKWIEKVVKGLKENGQLILSLPDESYSGKISPFFTHKEIVTEMIVLACKNFNKEIRQPNKQIPNVGLFSAPYYWESEKALRRSILHFKFTNINK